VKPTIEVERLRIAAVSLHCRRARELLLENSEGNQRAILELNQAIQHMREMLLGKEG
jgi:hypothetical protein